MESSYKDFILDEVKMIDRRIKNVKENEKVCGCKYSYMTNYLEKIKSTLLDSISEPVQDYSDVQPTSSVFDKKYAYTTIKNSPVTDLRGDNYNYNIPEELKLSINNAILNAIYKQINKEE